MKRNIFLISTTVLLLTVIMTGCKEDENAVTGVTLDQTAYTLMAGTEFSLVATVEPSNASNREVKWATMNPTIADVDADGKVIAKAAGTATITVITMDGGFKKECIVTVTPEPVAVSGILVQPTLELEMDKEEWLTYILTPSTANNKVVTAVSSDTGIASVVEIDAENNKIKLKGTGPGSAKITVTTVDGGFSAECTVNVIMHVSGITVQPTLSLGVEKEEWLMYTIAPASATNKSVMAVSDAPNVANVVGIDTLNNRIKVKSYSTGTARITVTALDGNYTDVCTATVSGKAPPILGNRLINPGFESINEGVIDNGNVSLSSINTPGWIGLQGTTWFADFYKAGEERLPPLNVGPGPTSVSNSSRVNSKIGNWWSKSNGVPFVNPVPHLPTYTFLVGSNLCRTGGGGNATGGFYQIVEVTPGETYRFGGRTGARGASTTDLENFKDGRMMILSPDGMTVYGWFPVDYKQGDGNPDLTMTTIGTHVVTFFVFEKEWTAPANVTEVRLQYAQRNFTVDTGSVETTGIGTPIVCWDEMFFEFVKSGD
ncbi:MAG: Ig-like domain-containing protein [Proteiniphilum sp.]